MSHRNFSKHVFFSLFGQSVQAYNAGMRSSTKRAFSKYCNPPFLLISLDVFARQAIITDASQLPQFFQILSRR